MDIIAEIGLNHNNSVRTAQELIYGCMESGADWVKFQVTLGVFHPGIKDFSWDQWGYVISYCDELQMPWFASCFSKKSIDFMNFMGMKRWKVPSGLALSEKYLRYLRENVSEDCEIILSTGLSNMSQVAMGLDILNGKNSYYGDIKISHCVSTYPTKTVDLNLSCIEDFNHQFPGHPVGLSDHSNDRDVDLVAMAMGYEFIERHVTLGKGQGGPDHRISLDMRDLVDLVKLRDKFNRIKGLPVKANLVTELSKNKIIERMEPAIKTFDCLK